MKRLSSQSERAGVFATSHFWSTLCFYLRVRRALSTAFHPQSDGQTERLNQVIEHFLRIYSNYLQDDWASFLPLAQLAYNTSTHSVLATSPTEALMGFRPDMRINMSRATPGC